MSRPHSKSSTCARLVPRPTPAAALACSGGGVAPLGPGPPPAAAATTPAGDGTNDRHVGSNYSDAVPKKAFADSRRRVQTDTGVTAKVNTVDHNTFQENINRYLQGSPDDVFTWFAGYRMQFFAAQGLAADIDDVWASIGGNYSRRVQGRVDGRRRQAVLRPVLHTTRGRSSTARASSRRRATRSPRRSTSSRRSAKKMKTDGLTPIAFADKDGWPAMGTFDILNMRINGYDFHIELMAGKESWTDPKVKAVFDTWRGLLPLHQDRRARAAPGRRPRRRCSKKKTGMYLLGTVRRPAVQGRADHDDLDFFPFPEIDSEHRRRTRSRRRSTAS